MSRPCIVHATAVEFTAQKLLLPQLRELHDRGFDVRLICAMSEWSADLAPFSPIHIPFSRKAKPHSTAACIVRLAGVVRDLKPAVLHLHSPAVALPARLIPRTVLPSNTRVVYTAHGFGHQWDNPRRRDAVLIHAERLLARRTDALLFQSAEDFEHARRERFATRLRWIGNGVQPYWFEVPDLERGMPDLRVLYVGRLVREKGLLDLLEALSCVERVQLTVAGAELPSDRDGVTAEARRMAQLPPLQGRVCFAGMVAQRDVAVLMARHDVLALPSWREGLPRSVIEGLAAGRPALVTDIRGCRELVTDGEQGRVVPPRSPSALADALVSLRDAPPQGLRAMGHRARARARSYREEDVIGRIVDAYAELGVRA